MREAVAQNPVIAGVLSYAPRMAKETMTYLVDDFDGSDADETVKFSLDGKAYEIDLTKKNAAGLRRAFKPYVDAGRPAGRSGARSPGRPRKSAGRKASKRLTEFSKLDDDGKARFRKWAKMPNTRRIADAKVQEWIKAGRP